MNKALSLLLALSLALSLVGCAGQKAEKTEKTDVEIALSDGGITLDGEPIGSGEDAAVYAAHDIVCYLAGQGIAYGEGTEADEHTQDEADAHTVVHITRPGTYRLSGRLSAGQVAVDLGEGAETDASAVVTLILDGADISCTVAPAIIFYRVFECGSKETTTASKTVDTGAAGANLVIADGSMNTVNGAYVARIYKSCTLSADGTEVIDSKKLHKYDGAVYSKMSMNVSGEVDGSGILNINAENEGLDSELHLTINGGALNIVSGNDGINTNEDGVSVTTVNGGVVNIRVTGETGEGDGIDSNGYLVINGGTVIASACADSEDAGIDSDCGIYLNGGTVIASGNMLDEIAGGTQNYAVFRFAQKQRGGETYTLRNESGEVLTMMPENAFSALVVSAPGLTEGEYTLWHGDVQLVHGGAMGGEMPHGGLGQPFGMDDAPIPPEGERPEPPDSEMRDDSARPEMPDGERREPPKGFPKDEFDGDRQPPQGGQLPMDMGEAGESSESFLVSAGGSLFTGVKEST